MIVHNRVFASSSKSWEALCDEASAFASEVGPEKLTNRLTLFNFVHLGLAPLPMLSARSRSPSATSLPLLACGRRRSFLIRAHAIGMTGGSPSGGPTRRIREVSPRAASQRVRSCRSRVIAICRSAAVN